MKKAALQKRKREQDVDYARRKRDSFREERESLAQEEHRLKEQGIGLKQEFLRLQHLLRQALVIVENIERAAMQSVAWQRQLVPSRSQPLYDMTQGPHNWSNGILPGISLERPAFSTLSSPVSRDIMLLDLVARQREMQALERAQRLVSQSLPPFDSNAFRVSSSAVEILMADGLAERILRRSATRQPSESSKSTHNSTFRKAG